MATHIQHPGKIHYNYHNKQAHNDGHNVPYHHEHDHDIFPKHHEQHHEAHSHHSNAHHENSHENNRHKSSFHEQRHEEGGKGSHPHRVSHHSGTHVSNPNVVHHHHVTEDHTQHHTYIHHHPGKKTNIHHQSPNKLPKNKVVTPGGKPVTTPGGKPKTLPQPVKPGTKPGTGTQQPSATTSKPRFSGKAPPHNGIDFGIGNPDPNKAPYGSNEPGQLLASHVSAVNKQGKAQTVSSYQEQDPQYKQPSVPSAWSSNLTEQQHQALDKKNQGDWLFSAGEWLYHTLLGHY